MKSQCVRSNENTKQNRADNREKHSSRGCPRESSGNKTVQGADHVGNAVVNQIRQTTMWEAVGNEIWRPTMEEAAAAAKKVLVARLSRTMHRLWVDRLKKNCNSWLGKSRMITNFKNHHQRIPSVITVHAITIKNILIMTLSKGLQISQTV